MTKNGPIGIFDSGIGGLTVAKAIRELLPGEDLIYFGDTAHLPYGEKSPEAVKQYSRAITSFLLGQGCKMIVIACNTASSLAFEEVQSLCAEDIAVINVIDPLVDYIATQPYTKVGVIGTRGTVRSEVYTQKIRTRLPDLNVIEKATPLFASMIEEGFISNEISQSVIGGYLGDPKLQKIDALVLACTHYPLIQKEISEFYQHSVDIIDASNLVAARVRASLKEGNILNEGEDGDSRFYMSVYTDSFKASTAYFFGDELNFTEKNLWNQE